MARPNNIFKQEMKELKKAQAYYASNIILFFLNEATKTHSRKNIQLLIGEFIKSCSYEDLCSSYKNKVPAEEFFLNQKKKDKTTWKYLVEKYLTKEIQEATHEPSITC